MSVMPEKSLYLRSCVCVCVGGGMQLPSPSPPPPPPRSVSSRLNILREDRGIALKRKQETALSELLDGRDVMAVLPTGFGKSRNYPRLRAENQHYCYLPLHHRRPILQICCRRTSQQWICPKIDLMRNNPPKFLYCSAQAAEMPFGLTITTLTFVALLSSNSSTFAWCGRKLFREVWFPELPLACSKRFCS